jgi:arabinofuranosyltransferase
MDALTSVAERSPAARIPAAASLALLAILLATILFRTSWLSDDAYITFRTIDNALHGYGLRWNVDERVQSYTHPLWLLILTPVVAATGNPFLSAIAVSLLLSAAAIGLAAWQVRDRPWAAAFTIAAFGASRAFVDFSSSGLENALSHLLLALLMLAAARPRADRSGAMVLGTIVGAIGTTRIDLLVLAVPIALGALRRWRTTLPWLLAGTWPLIVWEAFSIVYYGVPFPNTAYAKLATGIPGHELLRQGIVYVLESLNRDPLTLFTIAAAIGVPWALSDRTSTAAALALMAYLVYVVRIGGDFMSGRFFTAPFVVAVIVFARADWPRTILGRAAPLGLVVLLSLASHNAPIAILWGEPAVAGPTVWPASGIVDERTYYFHRTALVSPRGLRHRPDPMQTDVEIAALRVQHPTTVVWPTVGMVGFSIGPGYHIIDKLALADPLLARLPAYRRWRVGHYERPVPDGYLASVIDDANRVRDPRVHALYDVIREVTRGPLFSARRWRAIVTLNTLHLPLAGMPTPD